MDIDSPNQNKRISISFKVTHEFCKNTKKHVKNYKIIMKSLKENYKFLYWETSNEKKRRKLNSNNKITKIIQNY